MRAIIFLSFSFYLTSNFLLISAGTNCEKDECCLFGNSLCQNGGTCINEHGGYKCICISGFNGSHCEQNIDDCAENMCFPGSTCIDAVSNYYCECIPGRMGILCEYEDPCYGKNNKCKYGKCTRNEVTNNFTCSCDTGYEGRNCDQDIDECAFPDACFKGTCINTKGSFVCKCEPGFTGQLCNEMINECEPNQCKNGATCLDDIGRFICVCMPEYIGLYCETKVNTSGNVHCTLPCENGGLCRNSYCECPPPFTGPFCGQSKPDPCLRSNCTNGATCMPTSDYESFTCQCSPGYTGDNCQILAARCSQKPCKHGTCQATNEDKYYCHCEAGYTGINCDINIDDCADNPCLNNGFCLGFRIGSFLCVCPADTTGALCESKIHRSCENHACQNGALCVKVNNSYECRCNKGFAGKLCEIHMDIPTNAGEKISQSWKLYIVAFGFCVLFVLFTAIWILPQFWIWILPKSRKRKLTAPIWHPPIQNKDCKLKLTARIWHPRIQNKDNVSVHSSVQQGLQHPLIDPTCTLPTTSSNYYGENNKNFIKSSALTPNGNTLDSKKPKYDPKLTALHEQAGSKYCIQPDLINREDLFKRDSRGRTPLHWVVDSHFEKTEEMIMRDVDLLIGAGADVSALDNEDRTPLHLAVRRAREQAALKLLEHKAEILNVADIEDRTPLYDAVCVQSAKVVCAILHLSNDEKMVNTVVGRNDTALKACVALTHEPAMPILRMLLEHKANPNLAGDDKSLTYEGKTPLHIAASVNNHTFIRPLVLNGANKDAQDSMGRTPLFVAAENGHLESCMELLRLSASKDISDELNVSKEIAPDCAPRTPQLVAIENGYLELARRIENFVHEPEQLNSCDSRAPSRMRTNDEESVVPAKRTKKSPKTTRNTKQKHKEIGNLLTPLHSDKSSYSYTSSQQMAMSLHPVSRPPQTMMNFQPACSANPNLADSGHGITTSSNGSPVSQSPNAGYQSGYLRWSPTENNEKTLVNSDPCSKTWTLHSNSVATNVSPHADFEAPSAQCLNKPEHYFKQLSSPYEPNNSQINSDASTSASFDPYTATSIFQDTTSAHMQPSQAYGYPNDQLFYQNSGYSNSPFMEINPQLAMFYNPLRKPENPPTYNQYYSNPST